MIADNCTEEKFLMCLFLGPVVVLAAIVTPIVSAIALPIFILKAIPHWITHNALYKETLYDGSRVKYGRIPGQDYTQWDGRATNREQTPQDLQHAQIGMYVHGKNTPPREADITFSLYPFRTRDDVAWLGRELSWRKQKDLLDFDVKMIRAFSKGIIPIIGLIWILATETGTGGASEIGCRVCQIGDDIEYRHWSLNEAITFHRDFLLKKLNLLLASN